MIDAKAARVNSYACFLGDDATQELARMFGNIEKASLEGFTSYQPSEAAIKAIGRGKLIDILELYGFLVAESRYGISIEW